MTTTMYADVEQLLIGWAPTVVACRPLTETPDNLQVVLATQPVVRITRIGGPTSDPGIDQPTVDFDCFGLTRPSAKAFALQLWSLVDLQLSGYSNSHGVVLASRTLSGPSWRPWENTDVRRFGFTVRLTVHSR